MTNPCHKSRTLGQLRDAVESRSVGARNAAAALAALDIAEGMLGPEFRSAPLAASQQFFEDRFPSDPNAELLAVFDGAPGYHRWRTSVLRLLLLAGAGEPLEPFAALATFADAHGLKRPSRLILERVLPEVLPQDVDRETAIAADRPLRAQRRHSFRRQLVILDRLRQIDAVQALGLLGPAPIGALPQYLDGDKARIPLPRRLASFAASLKVQDARHLRRVFEVGVHAGVLKPDRDIAPRDLVSEAVWDDLQHALNAALPKAGSAYLRSVLREVRAIDCGAVPPDLKVGRRWGQANRVKAAKIKTKDAPKTKGELPKFIGEAVDRFAAETGACRSYVKALRRVFRLLHEERAVDDMDPLLRGAAQRLDRHAKRFSEGTFRVYRCALHRYLAHTGRLGAWTTLRSLSGASDMPAVSARGLGALETAALACEPPLDPADIDYAMALKLISRARKRGQAHRLREGLNDLDLLRPHLSEVLGSTPIGPLPDRRKRGNADLPEQVRDALERHGADAGFTPAGIRALRVAVTKLYSSVADRSVFVIPLAEIPFERLLAEVSRTDPTAIAPYRLELTRLAERLGGKWTKGWSRLQGVVVAAGVSRLDNPVEALARVAVAAGVEPWQLDREFAWTHECSLRPDLRLTWSANVDRFDALHAHPLVAQAGLLPPARLGPMPPRGGRARHALYPLPGPVEKAIEGEPKEILESAHFVWRFARVLSLYHRGDAPGTDDLFAETILRRVADGPHNLGRGAVRVHMDRIRGWRDDRIRGRIGHAQEVG